MGKEAPSCYYTFVQLSSEIPPIIFIDKKGFLYINLLGNQPVHFRSWVCCLLQDRPQLLGSRCWDPGAGIADGIGCALPFFHLCLVYEATGLMIRTALSEDLT